MKKGILDIAIDEMSSVLKPSLSPVSQNTSVPLNKPMHPQQGPQTYGQPSNHLSGLNVPLNNPQIAHNHPAMAHQSNHYSLNVPNSSGHYMGNPQPIPASNHPVANTSHQSSPQQSYGTQKSLNFTGGFQANLGHTANQNQIPPVSQPLMATNTNSYTPTETQKVQPQSNGTFEEKSNVEEDHVQTPKETSAVPAPLPQTPEKKQPENNAAPSPEEKVNTSVVASSVEKSPVQDPKSSPAKQNATNDSSSIEATVTEVDSKSVADTQTTNEQNHKEDLDEVVDNETETDSDKTDSPKKTEITKSPETTKSTSLESSPSKKDKEKKETVDTHVEEELESSSSSVDKTPIKQSTTPRASRKTKTPKSEEDVVKTTKTEKVSPNQKTPTSSKSKRARMRTQYYQSPLPEIEIISKISASSTRNRNKNNDDKLIVFYKNEFLAVRNSEGSFYICQAVQNIYKSSGKIRIRWLSEDKNDKTSQIYTPDFYDHTDFDCILTNINLQRVEKGKFKLPAKEKERTYSILKRSLAAEKGEDIANPDLSEEHPDGLDLSLYKDEGQIQKKSRKRKAKSPLKSPTLEVKSNGKKSPEKPKVAKVTPKSAKKVAQKKIEKVDKVAAKKTAPVVESAKKVSNTASRTERAKRRNDDVVSKVSPKVDHKKAKVLAKMARKSGPSPVSQSTSSKIAPRKNTVARNQKATTSKAPTQKLKVNSTSPASKVSARKSKRSKK